MKRLERSEDEVEISRLGEISAPGKSASTRPVLVKGV